MLCIFDTARTPFFKMGTQFSELSAADIGTHVVKCMIRRNAIDPAAIAHTIMGCVCQPPDSANIARIIALRAGIPDEVPALSVNRNCASGMEAVIAADQNIAAGRGDLFVVGGVDNMSQVPFFFRHSAVKKFTQLFKSKGLLDKLLALSSFRPKDLLPRIGLKLGLTDPYIAMGMGETAELLANRYAISREAQDRFAEESHRRANHHLSHLKNEIYPVFLQGKSIDCDNGIRSDCSVEKLAQLRPVFDRLTGSVSAGNSSQISDGAAALLVGTEQAGHDHSLQPIAELVDYSIVGCNPRTMGLGPAFAIEALMKKNRLKVDDIDIFEINEAFAAQVLACVQDLKTRGIDIPKEKLNRQGGAIALGHPVGATGARLIGTAVHQLQSKGMQQAIVSLCVGGGQGVALWIRS